VETGHRVAVRGRGVAPAFGPPDDWEEPHAAITEPRALLARREGEVGLGPLSAVLVLVSIELRRGEPVLTGELVTVLHPDSALLGTIDQEESSEGPPRLPAEGVLGFLFDDDHALAGAEQFRGGHKSG